MNRVEFDKIDFSFDKNCQNNEETLEKRFTLDDYIGPFEAKQNHIGPTVAATMKRGADVSQ